MRREARPEARDGVFIVAVSGFWRDRSDMALGSAAVPRVGLGPTTPPLCRCAERHAAPILRASWVFHRRTPLAPVAGEAGADGVAK